MEENDALITRAAPVHQALEPHMAHNFWKSWPLVGFEIPASRLLIGTSDCLLFETEVRGTCPCIQFYPSFSHTRTL